MKKLLLITLLISSLFLGSCSKQDKPLTISVTNWIGYTPIIYASKMGYLNERKISISRISSLADNMFLFKRGHSDAYGGTQYEFTVLKDDVKGLKALVLLDKSCGGDMIMSNKSIKELKRASKIDVYLEVNSVNKIILDDFILMYDINENSLNIFNQEQSIISKIKNNKNPIVIITYVPYNNILKDKGFKEIISTKGNNRIAVIDALFTTLRIYKKHQSQFNFLKQQIQKSIDYSKSNPKEYYKVVSSYMGNISYEEFLEALEDIKWVNDKNRDKLELKMKSYGIEMIK